MGGSGRPPSPPNAHPAPAKPWRGSIARSDLGGSWRSQAPQHAIVALVECYPWLIREMALMIGRRLRAAPTP
jgi:hypothetical protein